MSPLLKKNLWFDVWVEKLVYLKETTSHGKDPPDHLHGLVGVRQEGQPTEGKSHQHCQGNSQQQEEPIDRDVKDRQVIDIYIYINLRN